MSPDLRPDLRPERPSHWGVRLAWTLVSVAVVASVWHVDLSWERLRRLPAALVDYGGKLFLPPDWSQLPAAIDATVASVQMAWIGTVIAAVCSLPLAFLAASNVSPAPVRYAMRLLFNVIRAIPELVLAVAILSVTGLTQFTGALAIGIHSIGTLGKLSFEAIEGVDRGPLEAARAAGASRSQIVRWGILPQVLPEIVSFWLYRFEVNVRAGAVLGLIGAGGVGLMLLQNAQYRRWEVIGTLLVVVVVATILVDLVSGTVRKRIITGHWPWHRSTRPMPGREALAEAVA